MNAFAEFLHIHSDFPKRNMHKWALTVLILKSIMHSRTHRYLDHYPSSSWHINFSAFYCHMRVPISPSQGINRPADFIARHEKEQAPFVCLSNCLEWPARLTFVKRQL